MTERKILREHHKRRAADHARELAALMIENRVLPKFIELMKILHKKNETILRHTRKN